MASRKPTKPPEPSEPKLRFAAIVRVSTERQAEKGHSLNVQTKKIQATVARLGGAVTRWFRGQEHAVPDEPRMLLDSLLEEVGKNFFDAVIVTDISRWTRDVERNEQALRLLQSCGIRFFVGSTEYRLDSPEEAMMLQVGAVIGQFTARHQSKRSIESRIESAKKGNPSCGKRPWGRKWSESKGWEEIDGAKLKIQEIAKEYLSTNIGFEDLAAKWGISSQVLHKVLTKQAGPTWEQRFRLKSAGIDETILTTVPALLDEATIAAIKAKAEARRTWARGQQKHAYLFSRKIFDATTAPKFYSLTGCSSRNGHRYYRPYKDRKGTSWQVRADHLEEKVLEALGDALNRREAFVQAVYDNHADSEQFVADLMVKRAVHQQELAKAQKAIQRMSDAIADGTISNANAKRRLDKDEAACQMHKDAIAVIDQQLEAIPKAAELETQRQSLRSQFRASLRQAHERSYLSSGLAFDQDTINAIFGGKDPAGKKYGIYITPILDGSRRRYKYEAYGRLGNITGELRARETEPDAGDFTPADDAATHAQVAKGVSRELGINSKTIYARR